MKEQTILKLIESKKDHPDKALRTLMFALLASPVLSASSTLEASVLKILNLSLADYHQKLHLQHVWWNTKQLKVENLIASSEWMKNFLQQNSRLLASGSISRQSALTLLTDMLSMALQKASINDLKNHMKTKETERLLNALDDPAALKNINKDIFYPLRQAAKKKFYLSSDDFILRTVLVSEILGDYLLEHSKDPACARCQIALDTLHVLVRSDLENVSFFLNGQPEQALKEERKDELSLRIIPR